ncbi:MAG: SpoIVB peptidase S55 domain-containing protein [Acidobacteriota bacterium]
MKKYLFITLMIFLSATLLSTGIMEYSQLKPGMEGEGKTIFKGTKIETFRFKILGFLDNFSPGKNLIIAELKSPELNDIGVIAGMSGSPVYIDGKIIGSVSYGFSFSKKPIAGITPIEDILKVSDYSSPSYSIDISDIKIEFDKKNISLIAERLKKEILGKLNITSENNVSPIKLISTSRGINNSIQSYLKPLASQAPQIKMEKNFEKSIKQNFDIKGADAVSIPLVRGDFEYSSSGTVTYVKGNKIYMFGHPFFNMGKVSFPIHKAEVISVVPSYQESFKLSSTKNMIGAVTQDRFSSVAGELGKAPYMIPMQIFFKGRNKKFKLEMINHPLLTPALTQISIANIFLTEIQQFGFNSLKVRGKIFIENEKNIIIDDLFSGGNSYNELADLILAVNFFLMNNKEKEIKIQKIDFDVEVSETVKRANIENVLIQKNEFRPGEIIDIKILIRNDRGKLVRENIKIKAPNLKKGAPFQLLIADKKAISKFDAKNIKSSFFPSKLNSLIRAINNLRKNNRIYIKLVSPEKGLFVKGHEYSSLPSGLRNMFIYNTKSSDQITIKNSTITEYQMEVQSIISGSKLFKLKIRER